MNECITCLVSSPVSFFLLFLILQIIQITVRGEISCLPPALSWSPLFWTNIGGDLSDVALGKTVALNTDFWFFMGLWIASRSAAFSDSSVMDASEVNLEILNILHGLQRSHALSLFLGHRLLLHHWILIRRSQTQETDFGCRFMWLPSDVFIHATAIPRVLLGC